MSSPKGGATLSLRLMLALSVNLTQKAMAYGGYPLSFAHQVFEKGDHRPTTKSLGDCKNSSWLCIVLVRNPLDRAVSSFAHTLGHYDKLGAELNGLSGRNASFAQFVDALDQRAIDQKHTPGDSHFMPQVTVSSNAGVLSVPIEMLNEPDGYECPALARLQGWRLAELESSHSMEGHYLEKVNESMMGSEHLSWSDLNKSKAAHAFPFYDSFWKGNQTFCRHVVGCLFRGDYTMYVDACTRPELRGCAAYTRACTKELARLKSVCSLAAAS